MSVEQDLEAFRQLALEEQMRLPVYQREFGGFSYVYHLLDPLLEEILKGQPFVAITGEAIVSGLDEQDHYHRLLPVGGPRMCISGYSMGIDIVDRSHLQEDIEPGNFVVGFCVQIMVDTDTELPVTQPVFAFAPVESSAIVAPELICPQELILPEANDKVAQAIDECMLREKLDLPRLLHLFDKLVADNASDMQMDYYLNYLNILMPLDEYTVTVLTDKVVFQSAVDEARIATPEPDKIWKIETKPSHFEYHREYGLCIVVADEDDVTEEDAHDSILYPISDIYELTYATRDLKGNEQENDIWFAPETMN